MLPAAAIDLDADRHGPAPRPSRRRWVCGLLLAGLRLDGRETVSGVSARYLLATPPPPSVDNLILDATSGRAVRRLDGWQPVGNPSGTRLLVSRNDGAVTLVAHLDLKTGNVTVLGRSAGRAAPQACIVTFTLLACRTDQDRVPIWRVEM
jgi:hypothetical protein